MFFLFDFLDTQSGAARTLYHFHYVEWPENSIARSSSGLIDMLKNITKAQQVSGNGPITVHCRFVPQFYLLVFLCLSTYLIKSDYMWFQFFDNY